MTKTYWITKWALTKGIIQDECDTSKDETDTGKVRQWASHRMGRDRAHYWLRVGLDAFDNEADANRRVVEMIRAKLKSIDKQRAKYVGMLEELRKGGVQA